MLSLADWNHASAAKIALVLDEATGCTKDTMLILRLARLKNLALDSHTKNWGAWKVDRQTLAQARTLMKNLRSGAQIWEVFRTLGDIESGLYDRERKKGAATPMEEDKRRLFDQLRVLALEIDWLTARRQKLVEEGAANKGMNLELKREDFNAAGRKLRQVRLNFEQTRQTLRAMDSVMLLQSEEAALADLEKYYNDMPSVEDMERRQINMELQMEDMNRRNEAIARLENEMDSMFNALTEKQAAGSADEYETQVRKTEEQKRTMTL